MNITKKMLAVIVTATFAVSSNVAAETAKEAQDTSGKEAKVAGASTSTLVTAGLVLASLAVIDNNGSNSLAFVPDPVDPVDPVVPDTTDPVVPGTTTTAGTTTTTTTTTTGTTSTTTSTSTSTST